MSSGKVERSEIMRLLHDVLHDRYSEVPVSDRLDAEERQLVDAINRIYAKQKKQYEQFSKALRESEERLRSIIESTPVGICITTEDQRFDYVNPTYCKLYGYSKEELVGKSFTMVVPESERPRLSQLHDEFMGQTWELRGEWTVKRKDGRLMNILAEAAYIVDTDGSPKKVTFVVDITDRKRAEQRMRETVDRLNAEIAERMRIEKTKSEVERVIQHDLRNPLNGIISASEMLLTENLSEDQREMVDLIHESGIKLNSMISSSLDFIKMEEGVYELNPSSEDLKEVLRRVLAECKPITRDQIVDVRTSVDGVPIDEAPALPIFGERIYLEEAFSNLVNNAAEASPINEVVTIEVRTGPAYRVEIHNKGVIPAEIRGSFFERYATSGKPRGTGLGTYIAKQVIEVHRGRISFETSEEEGTTLIVELPRVPAKGLTED
jgi:PAS domain S-box-containing protein